MVQRFKDTILLLVVLLFSIQPVLADGIVEENTEPKNYCNDPKGRSFMAAAPAGCHPACLPQAGRAHVAAAFTLDG